VSTEWFEKIAGSDAALSTDDPHMLLIGDGVPDWVRLPPELGGQQVRVTHARMHTCPRGNHTVRHLKLDHDNLGVAECQAHGGFLWYRDTQPAKETDA
jgi:hypothetical protein